MSHYLVTDLAQNGDLFDYSIKLKQPMGELLSRHLFRQIVQAVCYLHNEASVVHRDLKLENILLDHNHCIKVCDFAMSRTLYDNSTAGIFYTQCGSERYMAPEIIEGKPYKGTSVDIFALGVTLFAMTTGVMPFDKRAHKMSDQLYHLIFKGDYKSYWLALQNMYEGEASFVGDKNISEEFKNFIMMFFRYSHYDRISLEQVRDHPWLNVQTTKDQEQEIMVELDRRR